MNKLSVLPRGPDLLLEILGLFGEIFGEFCVTT